MEFNNEYFEFVEKNAKIDPSTLRLRYHGDPRCWIPYAINNIEALRNRRKFILADGADLTPRVIPSQISAQQASSANVALLHSNLAGNALRILDMTFGIGMDARLMALHPYRTILGFDLQEALVDAAQINFADLKNVEVRMADSVEFLREYDGEPFDLIFIDPARRGESGQRLYNLHDCTPDLIELLPLLRSKCRRLMAKLSPMLDVTQTIRDLPGITALHIVEEAGECKELLAIVAGNCDAVNDVCSGVAATADGASESVPEICIDRLLPGGLQRFRFTLPEEAEAQPMLLGRAPRKGELLLEPSPAAMKAGAFNLYSSRFNAAKLHPNTNLYVPLDNDSDTLSKDFPGTIFLLVDVYPLTSSNLKTLGKKLSPINITSRNLPSFPPELLAKKMKIKQGGSRRLFAVSISTPSGTEPYLLVASKPTAR